MFLCRAQWERHIQWWSFHHSVGGKGKWGPASTQPHLASCLLSWCSAIRNVKGPPDWHQSSQNKHLRTSLSEKSWTLLPDMCYQIYAKDWLIPCISVISTNYKEKYSPPHTWWLSHTIDIMWQATAAIDTVISPKACPSFSSMFAISFEVDVADFSANLPWLWRMEFCTMPLRCSILGP